MSVPRAPRLWTAVLQLVLHPDDRRYALSDLEDGFERRARETDARSAGAWYRRQVARSVVPALGSRWSRRPRLIALMLDDLRFAIRSLAKTPIVALVVVTSLAVGIGATTAVFSAANAFLLRPASAAIADPDRLVTVFTSDNSGGLYGRNSVLDAQEVAAATDAFSGLATHRIGIVEIEGTDWVRSSMIEIVSGNYFDVLGVRVGLGRGFTPEETRFGSAERVVIISARLWNDQFGGDPGTIGETVILDGAPFTVIGVAPVELRSRFMAFEVDAWVPIGIPGGVFISNEAEWGNRGNRDHGVVARLVPGASMEQASAQLDVIAARLHSEYRDEWEDQRSQARRFTILDERAARVPPNIATALTAVSAIFVLAAGLLLAVACFNVAGIMLARADARHQEMAIRLALGARRRRIAGLLLVESLILASMACAAGIVLAKLLVGKFSQVSLPIANLVVRFDVGIDGRVLAFALVIAVLTSVAFGTVPAWRGARPDLVPALKGLRTTRTGARRRLSFRGALVLGQVAVALIFVVGAGTTLRSFNELVALDWGVEVEGLAVMTKDLPAATTLAERAAEYATVLQQVSARPEIADVQIGSAVEGTSFAFDNGADVAPLGYERAPGESMRISVNSVTPGYFELLQIRVLAGRTFTAADHADADRVAIVNESFARRFWPEGSALGRQFNIGQFAEEGGDSMRADGGTYTVIGLAADAKYQGFEGTESEFFWTALLQEPPARAMVVARAHGGVEEAIQALREAIPADARGVMMIPPGRLVDLRDFQFAFLQVMARFLGAAGAFGLLLATMGLYGTVAYAVAQRAREMAIRQAIGALPQQVINQVFHSGLRLALAGLVVGTFIIVPLAALLRADLHGVAPIEPLGLAAGAVIVFLATAAASYIPALRITRVTPVESLRSD